MRRYAAGPALADCFSCSNICHAVALTRESIMIVHRRTWFYRLAGQTFAQAISFKVPLTAHQVREEVRRLLHVTPLEVWSH